MAQVQHAALAHHRVEVQLLLHPLPELQGMGIELGIARQPVVRPHDGGVAPDVAPAEIALLEHRHVCQTVLLGEVKRRGQAMAAAADDDDIVFGFRVGSAPVGPPSAVAGQPLLQNAPARKTHACLPAAVDTVAAVKQRPAGVSMRRARNPRVFHRIKAPWRPSQARRGRPAGPGTDGGAGLCVAPPGISRPTRRSGGRNAAG